jgi:hypothetical protein
VAGIAGFKRDLEPANASAMLLRDWVENDTFTWIMTAEILEEYAAVLTALRVRPSIIGRVINLLREEAERVEPRRTVEADPDPDDSPFWTCAESADDFLVTLNRITRKGLWPRRGRPVDEAQHGRSHARRPQAGAVVARRRVRCESAS